MQVYCDMETEGGGWTVIQRRQDGSENFYRYFNDYVAGFGDPSGELWLGLEAIHRLGPTQLDRSVTTLRVELQDLQGNPGNATFETFGVLSSATGYVLSVARYSGGNAGDSLTRHSGSPFYTCDRDIRESPYRGDRYCANYVRGAWWFINAELSNLDYLCDHFNSHLNGFYTPLSGNVRSGIQWVSFTDGFEALSFSEMKIRRRVQ